MPALPSPTSNQGLNHPPVSHESDLSRLSSQGKEDGVVVIVFRVFACGCSREAPSRGVDLSSRPGQTQQTDEPYCVYTFKSARRSLARSLAGLARSLARSDRQYTSPVRASERARSEPSIGKVWFICMLRLGEGRDRRTGGTKEEREKRAGALLPWNRECKRWRQEGELGRRARGSRTDTTGQPWETQGTDFVFFVAKTTIRRHGGAASTSCRGTGGHQRLRETHTAACVRRTA